MFVWQALTVGMLLSFGAHAGGMDWLTPITITHETGDFVTYDCHVSGTPVYLPECAATPGLDPCSMLDDEIFSTGVILSQGAVTVAVGRALGGEHRYFELAVSDMPGDFDVSPECRDISVPGDLNPRVLFQPRFPIGCPQPASPAWVNVRAVGPGAAYCGTSRECRAVVYGP